MTTEFAPPINDVSPLFKMIAFSTEVVDTIYQKVKNFLVGTWQNLEGIVLLTSSSIGLTYLIGELPFIFLLPVWIEAAMVAPVAAVIIIGLLLYIAKKRRARRA